MKEKDILKLSEKEIQKIERVNDSIEKKELAEAQKESQKKFRILFERAAEEALPFIVYVIYMGAMGLIVLYRLLDYEGEKLYIGGFLLFTLMIAPMFVSPTNIWKQLFKWIKGKIKKQNQDDAH